MPEPVTARRRYLPGLDGLRALAVGAVVAYHVGFGWAQGGLLGVGVFFTLSGYLITDLLLAQLDAGGLRLRAFWLARARRLLPALALMLAAVSLWVGLVGGAPPGFGWALLAAALYVSNWQQVVAHVSYFARFGPPSPLGHLWSLAVEEQFYLLWPLLLLLGVRAVRERGRPRGLRPRLAALTLLLAAASALEMALLYRPSLDDSRVYYGTDTRAFELLIGAALAMLWPRRRLRASISRGARLLCDAAGVAALSVIGLLVWRTNEYSPFLYHGGFVLLSLASALLVAVLVHPASRLARVLGAGPLRWLGARSYGVYLWHLPVLVLTTPPASHGVDPARAALQVAATVALAALSWRYVEQPVRHGALGRWPRRLREGRVRLPRPAPLLLSAPLPLLALASLALTAAAGGGRVPAPGGAAGRHFSPRLAPRAHAPARVRGPAARRAVAAPAPRSSCRAVLDIGDSTSEGLVSPDYLPDPAERIEAQYARVGVRVQHYEISGARSIVETYDGQPNAAQVAQAWRQRGYRGCWVLALGTNDTADVAVGSPTSRMTRVRRMMALIGDQPVLWVGVKSLLEQGPYSEQNMELWNETLLQACSSYRNMRVFDWGAVAEDAWFIDDGIHYTTPGYAARARLIASALARAFPARGHSAGCLVR